MVISNQRTEEMVGDLGVLAPDYRRYVGNQAQRMAWCLEAGDLLVLPMPISEEFLRYILEHLRIDRDTVQVLVPPPGVFGEGVLSADRLFAEPFLSALRAAAATQGVDQVLPFHFDSAVSALVRELGLEAEVPGYGLLEQGGGRLLNSKAMFRALAGGAGVPVPEGAVCRSLQETEAFLWENLLSRGEPAILKQDFHVAGFGNEVVSPVAGVDPVGALRTVVTPDREAVTAYLKDRWPWLTDGGRNLVVVERYFADSLPIAAEFDVTDTDVRCVGHGEMRMKPVLNGHIWPAPAARNNGFTDFLEAAQRLCVPIQAMGYRGVVSVDAIVVPGGDILLNEYNCRVSGSTHAHRIRDRVVGRAAEERVLVELRRCTFPPFPVLLDALKAEGLHYDPRTQTGVLLTVDDHSSAGGYGEYCVVAESVTAAERMEKEITDLLASL
ncbi:peptide ligase PGM1-related protein [Streptomyces sp. NPDC006967]|uniref:preATP grasp domain-containing protein n=1 Tax=Streptomyces sp. NPDC006967 TaxID=3156906 RepID=UPI00340DA07B